MHKLQRMHLQQKDLHLQQKYLHLHLHPHWRIVKMTTHSKNKEVNKELWEASQHT